MKKKTKPVAIPTENTGATVEPLLLKPFSFTEPGFKMPETGTAERRAQFEEMFAAKCERDGDSEWAEEYRAAADRWRWLASLTEAEARPRCEEYEQMATDAIDALLVRAEAGEAEENAFRLYLILLNAQQALYSLAAHGNQKAGLLFANAICEGVGDFESLAGHNPEMFREWARKNLAIPGMISRNKEKTVDNERICKELQQGEDCHFAILPTGKRGWKIQDRANWLAARLQYYIQGNQELYAIHQSQAERAGSPLPAWLHDAAKLKPFSAQTWKSWATLAWRVLAEISPNGRPERHPAFHAKETRICRVRKLRINPYYGNKEASPSIAEHDIKEVLFGAFELIAGGKSRRTKQRAANKRKARKTA